MREDLISEFEQALIAQWEAKRTLYEAEHHYDQTKARAYLACDEPHFKANALAVVDPEVSEARAEMEDARLAHSRAGIKVRVLNRRLGGFDAMLDNQPE